MTVPRLSVHLSEPPVVVTVLQLENSYNALLVALDANQDEDLLPPEGFIASGPITPEGQQCQMDSSSLTVTCFMFQAVALAGPKVFWKHEHQCSTACIYT